MRTHEINRRLADEFDITVVCSRYRGATPRVEDGVRYVHSRHDRGRLPRAAEPTSPRFRWPSPLPSDLVVEDFGAPFSSVSVPWMTDRPVLGVVQWLFAKEKSAQYHLPFHWVEGVGVRSHRSMIAVSDDLGADAGRAQPARRGDRGGQRSRSGRLFRLRLSLAPTSSTSAAWRSPRRASTCSSRPTPGWPVRSTRIWCSAGMGRTARRWSIRPDDWGSPTGCGSSGGSPPTSGSSGWPGPICWPCPAGTRPSAWLPPRRWPCARRWWPLTFPACDRWSTTGSARWCPPSTSRRSPRPCVRLATDAALRRRQGEAGPDRVGGLNWDELAGQQGHVYRRVLDGEEVVASAGPVGGRTVRRPVPGFTRAGGGGRGDGAMDVPRAYRAAGPSHRRPGPGGGTGPGDTVGVCLPRSKQAVAAMMGHLVGRVRPMCPSTPSTPRPGWRRWATGPGCRRSWPRPSCCHHRSVGVAHRFGDHGAGIRTRGHRRRPTRGARTPTTSPTSCSRRVPRADPRRCRLRTGA